MKIRIWAIRKIGIQELSGNASFSNLLIKQLLSFIRVRKDSSVYNLIRRLYRTAGKYNKIDKSYSVFGEDQVLSKFLPELNGSYIDVGAAGPRMGSNTYLFYQRGWNGITIEPIKFLVKQHIKFMPRDTQIWASVTSKPGKEILFYQFTADDFSTNSIKRVSELRKFGIEPQGQFIVPNVKLSELEYKCDPLMPTLLNIDVEGEELSVLKSNNWITNLPRVIAIEEWTSPIYKKTEVRVFLENLSYKLMSRCFLTSIYVHEDYLDKFNQNSDRNYGWYQT